MNLEKRKLSKKLPNYDEICKFMKRVFPREEVIPMWLIRLVTVKKGYNFDVYYENNLFVGIIFTIDTKDTLFVFYLAVNDKIQSNGYGTILLQTLFNDNPDKSVTLFIETMDDIEAKNYNQRIKRLAFYKRNGFTDTGIKAGFKKPFVDILSTDLNYDEVKTKKLMKYIPMKIFPKNYLKIQ